MLALAFALPGCAMQWVRDGTTAEQADADELQCDRDAQYHAWRLQPLTPGPAIDASGKPILGPDGRFTGRGPYVEERRFAYFCMKKKGYRLEPST